MDFAFDATTLELRDRLLAFMDDCVYPAESRFREEVERLAEPWGTPPVIEELKSQARERGLWNLFLPPLHEDGAGLTNLQYAPLAEITGRSPSMAPEALNCSAPDTGNMELLSLFGTPEQKARWLDPLLDGRIRSAFSMTEPDVASSDATNIATRIERDGDGYVVSGRKWWTSGAMSPRCELLIVMGVTDPDAERHRRQSMIVVPKDTPGVRVVRSTSLFGYDDGPHGGHAEIVYDDVRVPAANLLGDEGEGFRLAQERLGPGRIHHAMRAIGMAERALEMLCRRTASRSTFGRLIIDHGVVQRWISEARVRIEQVRLLVLKTAWLMDTVGNRGARASLRTICSPSSTPSRASSRSRTGPTRCITWRSPGARRSAIGSRSRFERVGRPPARLPSVSSRAGDGSRGRTPRPRRSARAAARRRPRGSAARRSRRPRRGGRRRAAGTNGTRCCRARGSRAPAGGDQPRGWRHVPSRGSGTRPT